MLSRFVLIFALVAVCSATSCLTTEGIAVRPGNFIDSMSIADSAFAVVERVGRQYDLVQRSPAELGVNFDLTMCFVQDYKGRPFLIELCGKTKHGEAHFMLSYVPTSDLTPRVDSLRAALLDSLRARFGEQSTRECKWEFQRDARESGC